MTTKVRQSTPSTPNSGSLRWAVVAALSLATHAFAAGGEVPPADSGSAKTDKPGTLESIVVNGANDPQVAPSAAYVEDVISSDVVRNLSLGPTATAQSLLAQEPSVFVYANGPLGVETSIYFRAFNSGQFSETYAGVAINDVFNGGVTGQAENRNNVLVTPNNLGSVQLYRGINDPAVNSYNSLGGTINFNPRAPGDAFSAEVGTSYGTFKSYDWHGTVNTGDWNGLKQIISVEQSGSQGWIRGTPDYNNNLYWGASFAVNRDLHLVNYFLYNNNRGQAVFSMPLTLLDQFGTSYQWPHDWTNSNLHDTNFLEIFGSTWQASETVRFENKFYVGRNEYLRTSYSNPAHQASATQPYYLEDTPSNFAFWVGSPNGPTYDPSAVFGSPQAGTDFHFYGYTADAIGDTPTLAISLPGNDLTVGGNITHGKLHSREYWYGVDPVPQITGYNNAWDEHDSRTMASVFAQDTIALAGDRVHVTPGLKYVHAQTSDTDAVGFFYGTGGSVGDSEHFLSPTIGANYEVAKDLNVFAAFGKNVKLPDISSYYNSIQSVVVQPKLKPEYVDDFELGGRYRLAGFSVEMNLYRENFRNTFISTSNILTGLTLYHNGGSSVYQGFEAQFKADLGSTLVPGDLSAYFNYAYNRAYFTSSFTSDYTGGNGIDSSVVTAGQPLASVPQNLVSAGAIWKLDGWRANAEGQLIGKQYIDQNLAGTPTASTIGAHLIVNVGASRVFGLAGMGGAKTLRVGLNVDNLFDRRYLNSAYTDADVNTNNFERGIYAAPRIVSANVTVGF